MQYLHSMIRTTNEKEAIRFYCDFLGLKLDQRVRLEDCYLQYLTDEITGAQIELTINDKMPEKYINGNAFGHFAFSCENIDKAIKKAKSMGYKIDVEPFYLAQINTKIAFLNDFDGNSIELIEKN